MPVVVLMVANELTFRLVLNGLFIKYADQSIVHVHIGQGIHA